ncbi:MAG: hypothetical protein ABIO04_13620 [Ferruginibacter sp.]
MKAFSRFTFVIIFIILTQASCKKPDHGPDITVNNQLSKNPWRLSAVTISPALNGSTDFYNQSMLPCERDNIFNFSQAYQLFSVDPGTSVCGSGDPQAIREDAFGGWSFDPNNSILAISIAMPVPLNVNMTIIQINGNSFTGKTTEVISGITYTKTWMFSL